MSDTVVSDNAVFTPERRRTIWRGVAKACAVREYGAVRFGRLRWHAGTLLLLIAGLPLVKTLVAGDRNLTLQEAERLARAALTADAKRLPGLTLQPDPKPRRCATFDVLWANPGPGSAHSQFLTVDLHTAEVWRPGVWERVRGAALANAQRLIRARLRITNSEVKQAIESEHIVCDQYR